LTADRHRHLPRPLQLLLWCSIAGFTLAAAREAYGRLFLGRLLNQTFRITPEGPISRPHPIYGEIPRPGHYLVEIEVPDASGSYRFVMDVDQDGYRTTSPDPQVHAGQPEVWIFGCSFTWGFPLDNADSYPWRVQSALPEVRVRNYGMQGVGNVHALRQLRELLEDAPRAPPRVAVFGYCSFHRERNVGGSARDVAPGEAAGATAAHLLDWRQVLGERALEQPLPAGLPRPADQATAVTIGVMRELAALCSRHGIRPLLAVQYLVAPFDPVVEAARAFGMEVVDMQVDFRLPAFNVMPFDNHPNAEAHALYADKLLPALGRALAGD